MMQSPTFLVVLKAANKEGQIFLLGFESEAFSSNSQAAEGVSFSTTETHLLLPIVPETTRSNW